MQVACVAVCRSPGRRVAELRSEAAVVTFVTRPRPPRNLRLEAAAAASLKVRWDPPPDCSLKPAYTVSILPLDQEVAEELGDTFSKEVEAAVFTFSKLPEVTGAGKKYEVGVKTAVTVGGKQLQSEAATKTFVTKPQAPECLEIANSNCQEFSWRRSLTRGVVKYKFRVKKDEERPVDFFVEDNVIPEEEASLASPGQSLSFRVPSKFEEGSEYRSCTVLYCTVPYCTALYCTVPTVQDPGVQSAGGGQHLAGERAVPGQGGQDLRELRGEVH